MAAIHSQVEIIWVSVKNPVYFGLTQACTIVSEFISGFIQINDHFSACITSKYSI